MCELQSTIEFSVELYKFYNVDLFQRGMYQVRCSLRVNSKFTVEVEVTTPEVTTGLGSALVLGNYGACRPFQILYRNEEIPLKDVVLFRCHMLVDGYHLKESLEKAEFSLVVELWFSDTSPVNMVMVSSRTLQINLSPVDGLHYHLPVLFDYFHLSAITVTIHAILTALHQPSLKRGILRYMQSCAPKTSKSWSKSKAAQCSSLTDPVLTVTSNKIYSRINQSPQIQLEAYNVLLESSNNLKSVIKEYRILLLQREEVIGENYESLIIKQNKYDLKKNSKFKHAPCKQNSSLAELCADNIKLWNYFLLNFSCKTAIQQKLSKKHHSLRVKRFAELFFIVYNPRKTAIGCYETNYQKYLIIAELARRSKYMQLLPQLPVHCTILDGDYTTMPVIFEDQYQDFTVSPTKNGHHIISSISPIIKQDIPFRNKKIADDSSCSCGIGNLLDIRKSTEKTLVDTELYTAIDQLIPTRHSKSLDHLQIYPKSNLHNSLSNIHQNGIAICDNDKEMIFYKIQPKLKNVKSEHNMRRKYLNSHMEKISNDINCDCDLTDNFNSLKIDKQFSLNFTNQNGLENCYQNGGSLKTPKEIKLFNKKQNNQKLVKSISHTTPINSSIFRSNSMQLFSPKRPTLNSTSKFNSLSIKSCNENGKNEIKCEDLFKIKNVDNLRSEHLNQKVKRRHKIKEHQERRHFHISSSSSTESMCEKKHPLWLPNTTLNDYKDILKKSKSLSHLEEEKKSFIFLTKAESLPNVIPKLEERSNYLSGVNFCSSSSSSFSVNITEMESTSSLITSRSTSSSTDVPNPLTSALIHNNLETIQKKLLSLSAKCRNLKKKELGDSIQVRRKKKTKKYKDFRDVSEKSKKYCSELSVVKGCDIIQDSICEDFALPPPKQFRDLEGSPSSSVTNGTYPEEEINAVDNILYHVIDTQTSVGTKSGQFNLKSDPPEDVHYYKSSNVENQKTFLKSKTEFKRQLNFPGILYSDLNMFASTVPYFHISDEFRIFSPEGMHLIVCVHGLDGNSADLRLVKTYLELSLPGAYLDFLMSERNQGDTFSDFDTMTDRLVSEILHYLDTSTIRPTRVSFVGHSLGTIIIRSALTRSQMKFLLPRLHTFLSLSGPHLGTLYNSSGLVNMGMWFMQKWKKSGSLLQLCLKDATDPRQSFLYRQSQRSTIHHFKNVLLCGSGQDRYVPLHSARIELCKEAIKDTSEQGAIFREMVHNIVSPIISKKEVNLLRYDIHHALPNTANALIGRAAHIAVLDSELFIEKFMAVVGIKYFR